MRTTVAAMILAALVAAAPARAADWRPDCLSFPVNAPFVVTKWFGDQNTPFKGIHDGIDFGVPAGRPVRAMAGGVVVSAGPNEVGTNIVGVRTKAGRYYTLVHLKRIHVHPGQKVRRGQVLGLSGGEVGARGSGPFTTGPHVHVSVAGPNRKVVDPNTTLCLPQDTQAPAQ